MSITSTTTNTRSVLGLHRDKVFARKDETTNSDYLLTFAERPEGNTIMLDDSRLNYNPSTGVLTAPTIQGSINAETIDINDDSTDQDFYITFVDNSGDSKILNCDLTNGIRYNPSTGILKSTTMRVFTNDDTYSEWDSNSIFRKYSSTLGSGLHFTDLTLLPTDHEGVLRNLNTSLGNSSYRWNNIYAGSANFTGDILSSSGKLGIGTTNPLTDVDLGSSASTQKLAIYNNNWTTSGGNGFFGFGTGVSTLLFHSNTAEGGTAQMSLSSGGIITTTGDVVSNLSSINTNATDISTNATDISTNATDISTNATDIGNKVSSVSVSSDLTLTGTANDPIIGLTNNSLTIGNTLIGLGDTAATLSGLVVVNSQYIVTGPITCTTITTNASEIQLLKNTTITGDLTTTGDITSNLFSCYSDASNYTTLSNSGSLFRKYLGGLGSGLALSVNSILPTDYLGELSTNGAISLGSATHYWGNIHAVNGIFNSNVGIGTTNPLTALDLGNSGSTQKLAVYNSNWNTAGGAAFYGFGTGANTLLFHANTASGSSGQMNLNSNGTLTLSGKMLSSVSTGGFVIGQEVANLSGAAGTASVMGFNCNPESNVSKNAFGIERVGGHGVSDFYWYANTSNNSTQVSISDDIMRLDQNGKLYSNGGFSVGTETHLFEDYLISIHGAGGLATGSGIRLNDGYLEPSWGNSSYGTYPQSSAYLDLGSPVRRWGTVYTQNGVNTVSDRNSKTQIEYINYNENLCLIGEEILNDICTYKMKAAVENKGNDKSRKHFGVIAQELQDTFRSHEIDATEYGVLGIDWNYSKDGQYKDDDDRKYTKQDDDAVEEVTYSLRYDELNMLLFNTINNKLKLLEERNIFLENSLNLTNERVAMLEE